MLKRQGKTYMEKIVNSDRILLIQSQTACIQNGVNGIDMNPETYRQSILNCGYTFIINLLSRLV